MKKTKKAVYGILASCLLITALSPISVSASTIEIMSTGNGDEYDIIPLGNVTGYKYKILNGKQWKRLWSYTYNKWMEPEWTLA